MVSERATWVAVVDDAPAGGGRPDLLVQHRGKAAHKLAHVHHHHPLGLPSLLAAACAPRQRVGRGAQQRQLLVLRGAQPASGLGLGAATRWRARPRRGQAQVQVGARAPAPDRA